MQDETLISTRSIPMCLRYYFNWAPRYEKHLTFCPTDKNMRAWAKGNLKNSKRENEQKIIEIGLCHAYSVSQNVLKRNSENAHISLYFFQDFYSNEKNCLILWEPRWQRRDLHWHASTLGCQTFGHNPINGFYFEQLIPALSHSKKKSKHR